MDFLYIKALHIIFVVCWFAGLFYIVRLFIYQTEANQKTEVEKNVLVPQYQLMQKRLWYGITWPSAILTMVFGFWMYFLNFDYYLHQPWMMLKLSFGLRLFNEVATILLFAIVFLVTVKSTGSLVWGGLGLVILTAIIMTAAFIYKKKREKAKE